MFHFKAIFCCHSQFCPSLSSIERITAPTPKFVLDGIFPLIKTLPTTVQHTFWISALIFPSPIFLSYGGPDDSFCCNVDATLTSTYHQVFCALGGKGHTGSVHQTEVGIWYTVRPCYSEWKSEVQNWLQRQLGPWS